MKDREPIRMADGEVEFETSRLDTERKQIRLVASRMLETAEGAARYSVSPTPTSIIEIGDARDNEAIAKALAEVSIEDSNLRKIDLASEEGIAQATILALAKAKALEKEVKDPKAKTRLKKFSDGLSESVGSVLVKVGGRKAVTGAAALSLVATACSTAVGAQVPEVSIPTPETAGIQIAPAPTPTTVPTPEILATATETFTPFTPPVNPPEFTPGGAGGEFPEGIREQAEIDRYRALLVLARQEGRTIFGATDEEVKQQLNAFAEETNIEVKQEWNGKFGDEYQLVSVNVRTNPNGAQSVFWFATPGGALSARPDIPSEKDSILVEVPIEFWYFPEFRWGDDENIYMYKVPGGTNYDFAPSWFNTTRANYLTDGGLESAWELTTLSQQEIEFLADQLRCGNSCIRNDEFFFEPGHSFGIDMISSGRFKMIEVKDSNGNVVGYVDALVAITKDSMENPRLVYYAVQATTVNDPNLNLLRAILTEDIVSAGLYDELETAPKDSHGEILEPQSLEFLRLLYGNGSISRRIVATDLIFEGDSWAIEILRPIFSNPEYAQRIKEFGEKGGNVENYNEPILLFPS